MTSRSIMQTISLHDDVLVDLDTEAPWQVHCYREVLAARRGARIPTPELVTCGLPQDARQPRVEGGRGVFRPHRPAQDRRP